jgi:hypothetical protein
LWRAATHNHSPRPTVALFGSASARRRGISRYAIVKVQDGVPANVSTLPIKAKAIIAPDTAARKRLELLLVTVKEILLASRNAS